MDYHTGLVREKWKSPSNFFAMSFAASCGIATCLRLPWLAALHGGAFLWVYIIALLVVAWPMLLLELSLGQLRQKAAFAAFSKIDPRGASVGAGAGYLALLGAWCYSSIIAYLIVYFYESVFHPLPWTVSHAVDGLNATEFLLEGTPPLYVTIRNHFVRSVAEAGDTVSEQLICALVGVWGVVFWFSLDGVVVSATSAKTTLTISVIAQTWLFLYAVTSLDGAGRGLKDFFVPTESISVALVVDGVTHALFSSNVCTAVLVAFGSFNDVQRDIVKYSKFLILGQIAGALLAGMASFAVFGAMVNEMEKNYPSVTSVAELSTFLRDSAQDKDYAAKNFVASQDGLTPPLFEYNDGIKSTGFELTFASFAFASAHLSEGLSSLMGGLLFYSSFSSGLVTLHSWSSALLGILNDVFENAPVHVLSGVVCAASFLGAIPFAVGSIGYDMISEVDRLFVRVAIPFAAVCQAVSAGYLAGQRDSDVQDIRDCIDKNGKQAVPFFWAHLVRILPAVLLPVAVAGAVVTFHEAHKVEHTLVAACAMSGYPLLLAVFFFYGTRQERKKTVATSDIWSDRHITGHSIPSLASNQIHIPQG